MEGIFKNIVMVLNNNRLYPMPKQYVRNNKVQKK